MSLPSCFLCSALLSTDEQNKKIKCDTCNNRYCQICSGLNSTEIRVMQLSGKRTLKFLCETCVNPKHTGNSDKLFPELKSELKSLRTSINTELDDKISVIKNEITILRESNIQLVHLLSKDLPQLTSRSPTSPIAPTSSYANKVVIAQHKSRPQLNATASVVSVHTDQISKSLIATTPKPKPQWVKKTYKKESKPQIGTSNATNVTDAKFEGANLKKKKIWIFLSNVKDGVSHETVQKYIAKKCDAETHDIYVKPLDIFKKKQHNNCFMVGADPTFHSQLLECSFWPKGVTFDRFDFKKGRRFLDDPRYSGPKSSNNSQENWINNITEPPIFSGSPEIFQQIT